MALKYTGNEGNRRLADGVKGAVKFTVRIKVQSPTLAMTASSILPACTGTSCWCVLGAGAGLLDAGAGFRR